MQNGHALAIVVAPVSSELERPLHVHAVRVLLLHEHLRAAGAAAEARAAWSSTRARRARRRGCAARSRAATRRPRCSGRGSSCRGRRRAPGAAFFGTSFSSARRPSRKSVWCTTSSLTPKSGYSFFSVLKQCGHVVTTVLHPPLLLVAVERRRVRLGQRREEELVAGAPRRVARAVLLLPEDGEVDPGLLEQLRRGARDLLRAVVVARRAADPEEHRRRRLLGSSSGCRARRPSAARSMRDRFHGLPFTSIPWKGFCELCGNSFLMRYEVSAACRRSCRRTRSSPDTAPRTRGSVVQAQRTSGWMNSVTWTGLPASICSGFASAPSLAAAPVAVGGW